MHLLIFEPHDRGHYLVYIRHMLRAVPAGVRTTLLLRKGIAESPAYQQQLSSPPPGVEVVAAIDDNAYRDGDRLLADFTAALRDRRPDHVWAPSADLLLKTATRQRLFGRWRPPGNTEVECGLIETRCHRPPRRWRGYLRIGWERALLAAGGWARLHTIDPTVYAWAQSSGGPFRRIHALPDPVEAVPRISATDARRTLGVPVEGRYVVSVGLHALPRKGTYPLVEAFATAPMRPTDRLLLAGPLGDSLRARIHDRFGELVSSGRIVLLDRYVDDSEIMGSLMAADLVCTPYIDHMGSSAVVLQSAYIGRPVLAPAQGWFADVVPRFGLGDVDDILSPAALSAVLPARLDAAERFVTSAAGQRLLDYSSADNFGRHWARRLRERLSLTADPGLLPWEAVSGARL